MDGITEYGPRIDDTEMFLIFDIDAGCESFGDKQWSGHVLTTSGLERQMTIDI